MKLTHLFTTFPLLSETPNQRELSALAALPVELEIYSLWGGGEEFEGLPIRRFPKWRIVTLLWLLPYWVFRKPRVFAGLAKRLARGPLPSPLNAGETVLGLAFALCFAGRFAHPAHRPDLVHAAWATLPASAALLLSDLTGIPFSMAAHAYDVFRNGGDWDLAHKLDRAALVVTSCDSTRRELIGRGAKRETLALVRMGLPAMPAMKSARSAREPLRILSVGRLVEKKGYFDQIAVYAALRVAGLDFEARIVGSGHLRRALARRISELGLSEKVTLMGALPPEAVFRQYRWADVTLFTGKVAPSGDRDGLPNVVPEAMACGVPVVATAVAGVPEAVRNGTSGILIEESGSLPWLTALRRLQVDDDYYHRVRCGGRRWVETHYDAHQNVRSLLARFRGAAACSPASEEPFSGRAARGGGTDAA